MKKLICLLLVTVLGFTFSGSAIGGGVELAKNRIAKKETPIAQNVGDESYLKYADKDNGNFSGSIGGNALKKEIDESVNALTKTVKEAGGYVETYASEKEYEEKIKAEQKAEQKKSKSAAKKAAKAAKVAGEETFTEVIQTIEVLDKLTGKPISNAIVRLDGVPRFTGREGTVVVKLTKPTYELYVEKSDDNPETEDYNPYIEILVVATEKSEDIKKIHLKHPSDDIELISVILNYNDEPSNIFSQPYSIIMNGLYYATIKVIANVAIARSFIFYGGECVASEESDYFEDFIFEDKFTIDTEDTEKKVEIQIEYSGILSKRYPLHLNFSNGDVNSMLDPEGKSESPNSGDDGKANVEVDGKDESKPSFFGNIEFDASDFIKQKFFVDENKNSAQLSFSVDTYKGTIKMIAGYTLVKKEVDINNKKKAKADLEDAVKRLKNPQITKLEKVRGLIDKENAARKIKEIEKPDEMAFNEAFSKVKQDLKDMKASKPSLKQIRQLKDKLKGLKGFAPNDYRGKKIVSNSPSVGFDVDIMGTMEFSILTMQIVDLNVTGGIEFKFSWGGQFLIGWFPCFWDVEVTAGIKVSVNFISDKDEDGYADGGLKDFLQLILTIGAQFELGAGIADLASISGIANFEFQFDFNFFDKENPREGSFEFTFSIKLKALLWELKLDIYNQKWTLYGGVKEANLSPRTKRFNSTSLSDKQIFGNIYDGFAPKIVSVNDKKVAVWVADSPERDDYNRTELRYAVYSDNSWSESQKITNDGRADFYPDLAVVNDEAILVWQKSNKIHNISSSLEEMATAGEIYTSKFDYKTDTFVDTQRLTNDSEMDLQPQIVKNSSIDEKVGIVWRRNSENNILGDTGTNYIVSSMYKDGSWTSPENLFATDKYTSLPECIFNGEDIVTSLIMDNDGDLLTSDQDIFVVKRGELINVTKAAGNYTSLSFMSYEGMTALFFNKDGITKSINNVVIEECKFGNEDDKVVTSIKYASSKNGNKNIVAALKSNGKVKQIYCSIYDNNEGSWTSGIWLTEEKNNVIDFSVAISDSGETDLIYNVCDEYGMVVICHDIIIRKHDIKIENAYINQMFENDEETVINIEIFNCGDYQIKELSIEALGQTISIVLNEPIEVNDMCYLKVPFIIKKAEELENIVINCNMISNGKVVAKSSYDFFVGFVDLGINVERIIEGGQQIFKISVKNLSLKNTDAKISVYRNGEVCYTKDLYLDKMDSIIDQLILKNVENEDKLRFKVVTTNVEFDYSNNEELIISTMDAIVPDKTIIINTYANAINFAKQL